MGDKACEHGGKKNSWQVPVTELAVFEPNIHPSDTPNFLLNSGSIYTLRLALLTRPSSLARDVRV